MNLLPGKRYLFRELIPRAALLTLTFRLLPPLVPFALFRFTGGWAAALAFGIGFTAMFCLFGAYIMGSAPVAKFMETRSNAWWFIPVNVMFVLGVPFCGLLIAAWLAPAVLVINGLLAALAGSVVLNVACALTHDWGNGKQN